MGCPGILLAVAGTVALVMVVVTSVKKARRRMRYESWHLIHLYGYLGAGLALPHHLWTGTDFLASRTATVFWWTLYAVCAGSVLLFRVGLPLWRSLSSPLRVLDVRAEGPGVTTVTVGGPGWRGCRCAPASSSSGASSTGRVGHGAPPTRSPPRRTAARCALHGGHLGDGSARLARLRPGTRVLVEGPYGRLHGGVRSHREVLLMGSGIGITPLRALLEELDQAPGDVTVVHRVHDRRDAVLVGEIDAVAAARGARYLIVEGPRVRDRHSWLPDQAGHLTDAEALLQLAPDLADHDVYLCGSDRALRGRPAGRLAYDPTGLVKGWAVAGAAAHLDVVPEVAYSIGAGGDVVVGAGPGPSAAAPAWRIGIEDPRHRGSVAEVVTIRRGAVATSGAAARGAHVEDPLTGEGIAREGSATVVGPDPLWADVWATAAWVDPHRARALLAERDPAYRLITL